MGHTVSTARVNYLLRKTRDPDLESQLKSVAKGSICECVIASSSALVPHVQAPAYQRAFLQYIYKCQRYILT